MNTEFHHHPSHIIYTLKHTHCTSNTYMVDLIRYFFFLSNYGVNIVGGSHCYCQSFFFLVKAAHSAAIKNCTTLSLVHIDCFHCVMFSIQKNSNNNNFPIRHFSNICRVREAWLHEAWDKTRILLISFNQEHKFI